MWLNMLGLGDIAKTLADPAFQQTLTGFVQAFGEMHARLIRIEAKLDLLLRLRPDDGLSGLPAPVPAQDGPGAGPRQYVTTARIGDDGAGAAPGEGDAARIARHLLPGTRRAS
jgi:hypothetical protein